MWIWSCQVYNLEKSHTMSSELSLVNRRPLSSTWNGIKYSIWEDQVLIKAMLVWRKVERGSSWMSNLHVKLILMDLVRNERESCGTKYSNSYNWKQIEETRLIKKNCVWISIRNIRHCWLVILAIKFHPGMQFADIASPLSKIYQERKGKGTRKRCKPTQRGFVLFTS